MNNKGILSLGLNRVSYYSGAEEQYGIQRAGSRTHKQFLRKRKLGKFKKRQTK